MSEQDKNELNPNDENHKKKIIRKIIKKDTTNKKIIIKKTNAGSGSSIATYDSSSNENEENLKEKKNSLSLGNEKKTNDVKPSGYLDQNKKTFDPSRNSSDYNRNRPNGYYNNYRNSNSVNNSSNGNYRNFTGNNRYQNNPQQTGRNYNSSGNNFNRGAGSYNKDNPQNTGRNYPRGPGNFSNGNNQNQRRDFANNNNRSPGGIAGGFRPKQEPASTPATNDKDRSRKKLNQKKDEDKKGFYSDKPNSFEKNFIYKKKEKNLVNSVPEVIDIVDVISISDLARKMNLKANVIISKLMELGSMFTINDKIDAETATIVASEFNCKINIVSLYDETLIEEEKVDDSQQEKRPPIVTVMGHVDHGKTKLLDAIRHSDKASFESGGITQHIGAYSVTLDNGEIITFIDTPGHEAFTMMRARGAQVTDIVILVVAADDGVMPQTIEAINHAKQANVPVIVAINKCDKPDANPDKVKQQLSEYGLLPEEWGGQTMYCNISALKKIGIQELLETVVLQAEIINLKAPYKTRASGFVLESKIDQGRGVVVSILVSKGTLNIGDFFVAGVYNGKIRAMWNDKGKRIKSATPSTPVEITGIEKVPNAGDPFNVLSKEKETRLLSSKRKELNKMEDAKSVKKLTLNDFLSQKKDGEVQEIKVIIKADVQGSAEAIKDSLDKLSNSEVKLTTVHLGVGPINESDVIFAVASKAILIGFRVRPNMKAQTLADKEKVDIRRYNIIYDVIEDIKAAMEGMIKPDLLEELIGTIEVKQVFKISKIGTIAGSIVTTGKVKRKSLIRLMRDDVLIYSGKISSLKRFKDDAAEVIEGTECGIGLENCKDIKTGDIMEAYEIKEISRNLADVEKKEKQELEDKKIADMKELKRKEEEELRALLELDKEGTPLEEKK